MVKVVSPRRHSASTVSTNQSPNTPMHPRLHSPNQRQWESRPGTSTASGTSSKDGRNKDLIPTHEGSSGDIRKDPERSEQGPHHVNRETGMSVKQRLHTHPRIRLQALKNLCLLLRFNVKGVDPKILEKLQVLDVQGMIFGRATHPIGEAHFRGCDFPWRTLPPA